MTMIDAVRGGATLSLPETTEILIIGAGVGGINALYEFRQRGWDAMSVEAGDGVGGTWFWNRYPGCRVDSESYSYGYYFDKQLLQDWSWSEHFATQPENEEYLNHVVERFELGQYIHLNRRVASAHFNEERTGWDVTLTDGARISAKFVVTAVGILSAPQYPKVPGRELFRGESHHTGLWPKEKVDFAGKRVAVIGTGSSGTQVIEAVAGVAASLTVFQRTPNWATPLNNGPISAAEMDDIKTRYDDIWESCQNPGGFVHRASEISAHDVSLEERRAFYATLYDDRRGWATGFGNYPEVRANPELNREFCDYLAERIRGRVNDPVLADKLTPKALPYGVKRPPMENGYYEVFNRSDVTLVDLRETPLVEVTETGLRTTEATFEFDIIVYATGFDAITGSFHRMDVRGVGGVDLKDHWDAGPRTYVASATDRFPNMLFIGGPQGLSGNIPRCLEHQVTFAATIIDHAKSQGHNRFEVEAAAVNEWVDHVNELINASVFKDVQSWAFGDNTDGKPRAYGLYGGGMVAFGERLDHIVSNGFEGFTFSDR